MYSIASRYTNTRWIRVGVAFIGITVCLGILATYHSGTPFMPFDMHRSTVKIKQIAIGGTLDTGGDVGAVTPFPSSGGSEDSSDKSLELKETIRIPSSAPLKSADQVIQRRFETRARLREKVCNRPSYQAMRNATEISGRFSRFADGLIRWCRIPKIGTTYLLGVERQVFRGKLNSTSAGTRTILLTREPYSRLVSGYIGKIVTNPPWARSFGADIIIKFRPGASENAKKCGHDVTFPEFLKFFIESELTGWRRNLHFVPMYKQCNPCTQSYDYIGHLETLKDDLTHVLKSVNVSVDMDFSDEEGTLRSKARAIVAKNVSIVRCEPMCSALAKVWWSFQARGLISTAIAFPLTNGQCDAINGTAFADLAWDAHIQSIGRIDKVKQRREAMVTLYLQASLTDRMKVRELLSNDFELYGYDPLPPDLFPEL